nr:MAG TPA: hypothetical protein [Caudoviricetes sp.]
MRAADSLIIAMIKASNIQFSKCVSLSPVGVRVFVLPLRAGAGSLYGAALLRYPGRLLPLKNGTDPCRGVGVVNQLGVMLALNKAVRILHGVGAGFKLAAAKLFDVVTGVPCKRRQDVQGVVELLFGDLLHGVGEQALPLGVQKVAVGHDGECAGLCRFKAFRPILFPVVIPARVQNILVPADIIGGAVLGGFQDLFRGAGAAPARRGEIVEGAGGRIHHDKLHFLLFGHVAKLLSWVVTHERPPRRGRLGLHQRRRNAVGLAGHCGSFGKHFLAERFNLCGGLDGKHDDGDRRIAGTDSVHGGIAARRAVIGELCRVYHAVIVGIYQDGRCADMEKPCKAALLLAGGDVLQEWRTLHGLFVGGVALEDVHQIRRVLFYLKTILGGNDGHAVGGAFAECHGLDHVGIQDRGQLERGICRDDIDQIAPAGDANPAPVLRLLLEIGLDRLDIEAEQGEVGRKFHSIILLLFNFQIVPAVCRVWGGAAFLRCGPARVSHSAERSLLAVRRGAVCAGGGGCFGLGLCFGGGFRIVGRRGGLRRTLRICDGLPGIAPLCQRFRLGGAVLFGHGHKFVHRFPLRFLEFGHAGRCFLLGSWGGLFGGLRFALGLVLLDGGSLGGFALVG